MLYLGCAESSVISVPRDKFVTKQKILRFFCFFLYVLNSQINLICRIHEDSKGFN